MAAKMVDRGREFTERIVSGFVLDDAGKWITLAERKKVEEEVLAHLMGGRLLHEGRWLSFDEVKTARQAAAVPPEEEREETRVIEP
jgi:hypothetical protein